MATQRTQYTVSAVSFHAQSLPMRDTLITVEQDGASFIAKHSRLGAGPKAKDPKNAIAALLIENGYSDIKISDNPIAQPESETKKPQRKPRVKKENTVPTVTEKPVKKPAVKKAVKKPAAKKPTSKTSPAPKSKAKKPATGLKQGKGKTTKPVKKPPVNDGVKIEGLRLPQAKVLRFLAKSNGAKTRKEIAGGAKTDQAGLVEHIGSYDKAVREANDAKHFPSLISLKLVKHSQLDVDGKNVVVYEITAAGRKKVK